MFKNKSYKCCDKNDVLLHVYVIRASRMHQLEEILTKVETTVCWSLCAYGLHTEEMCVWCTIPGLHVLSCSHLQFVTSRRMTFGLLNVWKWLLHLAVYMYATWYLLHSKFLAILRNDDVVSENIVKLKRVTFCAADGKNHDSASSQRGLRILCFCDLFLACHESSEGVHKKI